MSTTGLILGAIIILIALLAVLLPVFGRRASTVAEEGLIQKQRERLLMVYERVLTNLRDLDEDHATGKMQDADYQTEREVWTQRGIQVLKTMDSLQSRRVITASQDAGDIDRAIDRQIEEAVKAMMERSRS